MSIRLIVGLGNPGPEYEQTRHNAGFWLVDNLAGSTRLARETRFNALAAKTFISGNEVWLLEPQTFMNRSGQSVGALARFYKIAPDEVLVVHDELDLPPGVAKIKKGVTLDRFTRAIKDTTFDSIRNLPILETKPYQLDGGAGSGNNFDKHLSSANP